MYNKSSSGVSINMSMNSMTSHEDWSSMFEKCSWMQETWDILCLLLMIRINYHHQLIMNRRRIPCLDDYLDRINLALWPRFKASHLATILPKACHMHHVASWRTCETEIQGTQPFYQKPATCMMFNFGMSRTPPKLP